MRIIEIIFHYFACVLTLFFMQWSKNRIADNITHFYEKRFAKEKAIRIVILKKKQNVFQISYDTAAICNQI